MRGWPEEDPGDAQGDAQADDGGEVPRPGIVKPGKAPLPRTALSLAESMKGLVVRTVMW